MSSSTSESHNKTTFPNSAPSGEWGWAKITIEALDLVNRESDYTHERATEVAEHQMLAVVELTDLAIDPSLVSFQPNYKLKDNHGMHHSKPDNRSLVTLSMHSLEQHGWVEFCKTTRHELIHVWQHQNDVDDDEGCNHHARTHGESFERWMDVLSVEKWGRGLDVDAKYIVSCPDCTNEWEYHRDCRTTKSIRKGSRYCTDCGDETSGRLELYEDGVRQLTAEMDNSECEMLTMLRGIDAELADELALEHGIETADDVVASLLGNHEFDVTTVLSKSDVATVAKQLGLSTVKTTQKVYIARTDAEAMELFQNDQ